MRIINSRDIMETIEMLTAENLDVRTVTMGISLLDCIDPDGDKACEKIYNKIVRLAGNLVPVVDGISAEYGIPIVNKRISVTPIAMLLGAAPEDVYKRQDLACSKILAETASRRLILSVISSSGMASLTRRSSSRIF